MSGIDNSRPTRLGRTFRNRVALVAADLLKYGLSSAVALALDFSILVFLTRIAGVNYLLAAALGYMAGMAVVYILSIRLIFSDRRHLHPFNEFAGFFVIGCVGLLLNEFLMLVFVEFGQFAVVTAKVPTAGCVFLFNFVARRFLLFSKRTAR